MESINASKVEEVGSEWSADDKLQESQKLHIVAKCKSLGIDVNKFINLKYHMGQEDAPTYKSIDDVPRGVAGKMVKVLSEYQSETGDNESRNVPEVIMLENE